MDSNELKTCSTCKETKARTEFYKASLYKDGLMYVCKLCARSATKSYYKKNPMARRIESKRYREANPEKTKDRLKKYRKENRAKIRETERAYYHKNKEKLDRRSKARFLRVLYNLPIERYEEMFKEQHGACALCGDQNFDGRRLAVDHDHKTGSVRALL